MLKHHALESGLRSYIKKRKIIEMIVCTVLFAVSVFFVIVYEQSKVIEDIDYFFVQYQSVTYNYDLIWGIMISWLLFTVSAIITVCDLLFTKVVTVDIRGDHVTFYRGLLHTQLYVNGDLKDEILFSRYYLEAALPDGTKVNVALGKWSAHMTFSDGHPPIDI